MTQLFFSIFIALLVAYITWSLGMPMGVILLVVVVVFLGYLAGLSLAWAAGKEARDE